MGQYRSLLVTIFGILLFIVTASVLYTNNLSRQLAEEEQRRIQIWAQATERLILAEPDEDIDFYSTMIEHNTTIPVYITDSANNVLHSRNVQKPVSDPRTLNGPIEIRFVDNDGTEVRQYIYYDESTLLHQLRYVPYAQFAVIFIFIAMGVFAMLAAQRNAQNRVWVGLSKETAHQLGTPISSLNGWQTLLEARYKDDEYIPQMRADIDRLQVIADRFSKVGSLPELEQVQFVPVVRNAMSYMRARTSNKVTIDFVTTEERENIEVMLNKPLFEWVIENLIKNAIDAMNGSGSIVFSINEKENTVLLDVADTGKGMDRHTQRHIFDTGFTTKSRGWGLGLPLAKRIIEDYHGGKLFLKQSEIGVGSTFRIILNKCKDS